MFLHKVGPSPNYAALQHRKPSSSQSRPLNLKSTILYIHCGPVRFHYSKTHEILSFGVGRYEAIFPGNLLALMHDVKRVRAVNHLPHVLRRKISVR
jgi:hypothetical protein